MFVIIIIIIIIIIVVFIVVVIIISWFFGPSAQSCGHQKLKIFNYVRVICSLVCKRAPGGVAQW